MKRLLFIAISFAVILSSLHSQEMSPRKEGTHFLEKDRVYSEDEFQLIPEFGFSDRIRSDILEHGTVFLVEFLYRLPELPPEIQTTREIANLILDVETLEGIEYWSGWRKRMHPYIRKSYRVENLGSKKPLPPLVLTGEDESASFIQYQKDTTFGNGWYRIDVEQSDDSVLMTTLNLTELKALTKKTAEAGGVLVQMAVIPHNDHVVLYCVVGLSKFPDVGWSQGGIAGSFNHRISALEAWFADRVYGRED